VENKNFSLRVALYKFLRHLEHLEKFCSRLANQLMVESLPRASPSPPIGGEGRGEGAATEKIEFELL
jgi:hypothetical protein